MIRLLTCALAFLLAAGSASAQPSLQLRDLGAEPSTLHAPDLHMRARINTPELDVRARTNPTYEPTTEPAATFGRRASAVASTVVRTLAARNRLWLGPPEEEMDAYLRPPRSDDGEATIFHEAKALYDEATSYRTDRYDISFDPLSLKCHLKIRLSP